MTTLAERWNNFWFKPASPDNLGLCRVILFGAMFFFYLLTPLLFPAWGWHGEFSAWGKVSSIFWSPIWLFAHLHLPPLSAEALAVVQLIWRLALGLSCIGLFTRWSTAISFILGLYLLGLPNNFGRTHHLDTILVFAFLVMAFSRCGDAWSVDVLIRTARHGTDSLAQRRILSGEYTWPVRAIWLVIALVYFAAGFAKIRHSGLQWITSDTMAIFLMQNQYHKTDAEPWTSWGLLLAQSTWLSHLLAAAGVLLEVSYPIALFSRRARLLIVPGGVLMQSGTAILLGPNFYQLIICQLLWVPWDWVAGQLRKQRSNKGKYVLLFDGACGLCQRTVALAKSLDLMGRVDFRDVTTEWIEIERRFPNLRQEQCLTQMYVITSGGQAWVGFDAYRGLAKVLPLGWLVLPILYLPGMPAVASWMYRKVASCRHRGACPLSGSLLPGGVQASENLGSNAHSSRAIQRGTFTGQSGRN